MALRKTFADIESLQYRLRAACALLGVTDNTLRSYADTAGINIKRASDMTPGAPPVRLFDPEVLFHLALWRRNNLDGPPQCWRPLVLPVHVVKGGTGKTTTAVELAVHLQLLGIRVLIIDLDIQSNASQLMGYEPDLTKEEAASYNLDEEAIIDQTFASILVPFINHTRSGARASAMPKTHAIKKPFGEYGPHLVPSDIFLGDVEQALANAKGQRELYIRNLIEASSRGELPGFDVSRYDVVIFDCPPNVSFTSTAALGAADIVIAPIRMDAFSVKGLTKLMSELDSLEDAYKIKPDLVILPTHYAPQLARIGRMQQQLNQYRNLLANGAISSSEEFPKSLDNYLPLALQRPTSNAAKEYRLFAEFMHAKIAALCAKRGRKL